MKYKEVELYIHKDMVLLPKTIECPDCGRALPSPKYICEPCALQIVLIEQTPDVILD
jgi:hypothetical protein